MLNQIKTVGLLAVLSAMLVGVGGAVHPGLVEFYLFLALVMNVGAYFFSDRLVLSMHGAVEVGPDQAPWLHQTVAELAQTAGIPKPKVYLIRDPSPNAFATGRNPSHGVVAVTQGILNLLDRRQLRGVLAHEIGHIANRDVLLQTIAAVMVSVITSVAGALRWGLIFGGHRRRDDDGGGAGALLIALVAPFAAMLVQLGISRSREYLADEAGARISGDPLALASALETMEAYARGGSLAASHATASMFIVNPLRGGGMAGWFSTHPATAERVKRLRAMAQR